MSSQTIAGTPVPVRPDYLLGRWQRVILAEFDGPNERRMFVQVFGI